MWSRLSAVKASGDMLIRGSMGRVRVQRSPDSRDSRRRRRRRQMDT